jgi:HK97 family phage portal protein
MAPVNWVIRNFTEAELRMERKDAGRWSWLEDHELVALIDTPNPFYSGDLLWKATLVSYILDGNAYWLKIRNVFGKVVELWYLPHFLVEPAWPRDDSAYLTHYDYKPRFGGKPTHLALRDVIHFRFGLDPRNTRKGLSQLKPLLREVFTDDEAANFSASILRNMGVPGGLISPAKGSEHLPGKDEIEEMKEYMRHGFTGDRRGEWLVLGTPTDVSQFGFDPQQLQVSMLRDIAEERVCAALGIPAAVVGFGSGLQQTKVGATMKELRRLAWTSALQPMQRSISRELNFSYVPEAVSQTRRFRLGFDVSRIPAFAEEEMAQTDKVAKQVAAGLLRVDRGQEALGLEVDPTQAVYLRPSSSTAVIPGVEPMPTPPSANGNGNGNAPADQDGDGDEAGGDTLQQRAAALLAAQKDN